MASTHIMIIHEAKGGQEKEKSKKVDRIKTFIQYGYCLGSCG